MKGRIQEISDTIKQEFVSNQTLIEAYGLTEGKGFDEQFSKVSIESMLIYIFASSAWLLEQMWNSFKSEMEKRIDESYITSPAWYYQKALEYQGGDSLVFDNKTYSFRYGTVNESKRIVKNAAIRQVTDAGVTKLKVYFSGEGKTPLTGDARTSFETYMCRVGAAGTHFLFVSAAPDTLRVHLHIYYDPLVLDSTGTRLSGGGKPVEEAIENYLGNLEYGGIFYASKLVDVIQATPGVKDVTLDGTTWKNTKDNRRRIDSDSGAFKYVPADGDITYTID